MTFRGHHLNRWGSCETHSLRPEIHIYDKPFVKFSQPTILTIAKNQKPKKTKEKKTYNTPHLKQHTTTATQQITDRSQIHKSIFHSIPVAAAPAHPGCINSQKKGRKKRKIPAAQPSLREGGWVGTQPQSIPEAIPFPSPFFPSIISAS